MNNELQRLYKVSECFSKKTFVNDTPCCKCNKTEFVFGDDPRVYGEKVYCSAKCCGVIREIFSRPAEYEKMVMLMMDALNGQLEFISDINEAIMYYAMMRTAYMIHNEDFILETIKQLKRVKAKKETKHKIGNMLAVLQYMLMSLSDAMFSKYHARYKKNIEKNLNFVDQIAFKLKEHMILEDPDAYQQGIVMIFSQLLAKDIFYHCVLYATSGKEIDRLLLTRGIDRLDDDLKRNVITQDQYISTCLRYCDICPELKEKGLAILGKADTKFLTYHQYNVLCFEYAKLYKFFEMTHDESTQFLARLHHDPKFHESVRLNLRSKKDWGNIEIMKELVADDIDQVHHIMRRCDICDYLIHTGLTEYLFLLEQLYHRLGNMCVNLIMPLNILESKRKGLDVKTPEFAEITNKIDSIKSQFSPELTCLSTSQKTLIAGWDNLYSMNKEFYIDLIKREQSLAIHFSDEMLATIQHDKTVQTTLLEMLGGYYTILQKKLTSIFQ